MCVAKLLGFGGSTPKINTPAPAPAPAASDAGVSQGAPVSTTNSDDTAASRALFRLGYSDSPSIEPFLTTRVRAWVGLAELPVCLPWNTDAARRSPTAPNPLARSEVQTTVWRSSLCPVLAEAALVHGRSVRLYLVDGSPTGIVTAEIMNWTGHALVAPRSRLGDALVRDEPARTGVYFLVGDDPDQPTKGRVYVGEGDSVVDRIKSHSKDPTKDFWSRVCIVMSKDANLTKAHVRYLEQRFVELTKAADRANLSNGNEPSREALPESDIADMEVFVSQVEVILPVVGFDLLRPKGKMIPPLTKAEGSHLPAATQVELVLTSDKHGYEAHAVEVDGEITVLKDSMATAKNEFSSNGYSPLREQLIRDGRPKLSSDPNFLRFTEDVAFASASAAAAVIRNRNTNGRTSWRLASTGQTLKAWQDAQLGIAS